MTFIDFFAGIGGFRLGMEMAGHKCVGHCEIDKFADKSYRAMHDVKGDEWFADDIRGVNAGDMPEANCWCGGFPCQAFSVAGKRRGFEDMRGTLIFEVFRLAAERKPKILFLENVAGLLNHDGGRTFGTILCGLWELGYDVQWQVLNSKNFGVPQNRERVFIIGHHGTGSGRKIFPIYGTDGEALKQIIGGSQGYRVYDPVNSVSSTLASQAGGIGAKTGLYMVPQALSAGGVFLTASTVITKKESTRSTNAEERTFLIMGKDGRMKNKEQASCLTGGAHSGGNHSDMDLIVEPYNSDKDGNARCIDANYFKGILAHQDRTGVQVQAVLTPDRAEKRQNGRRMKEPGEEMFTLTSQDRHGVMITEASGIYTQTSENFRRPPLKGLSRTLKANMHDAGVVQNARIRRLTPKECFRLQGFPDEYFERAVAVNSDSQLYKQAGNSVSVPVIYEIAKRLSL
jgi:DNA (cytosine-5)-methyltransferase 1